MCLEKENLEGEIKGLTGNQRRQLEALTVKKSEIQTLLARLETLESEFAAYRAWKSTYEAQQEHRETERKERQVLFSLQKEMEVEWSSRKNQLGRVEKAASKSEKDLEKQQAEIAATELRIQKASDEIVRMNKTKEELKELLAQKDDFDPNAGLADEEAELTAMQAELAALQEKAKEADRDIERKNRCMGDDVENLEEKYNQLRSERKGLEQKASNLRTQLEEGTLSRTSAALKWERHLAILERGAKLLVKAKKEEQEILDGRGSESDEYV